MVPMPTVLYGTKVANEEQSDEGIGHTLVSAADYATARRHGCSVGLSGEKIRVAWFDTTVWPPEKNVCAPIRPRQEEPQRFDWLIPR
jgi:hypothetical protein